MAKDFRHRQDLLSLPPGRRSCNVFSVRYRGEKPDRRCLFQGLRPSHNEEVAVSRLRYAHLRILAPLRFSNENRCLKLRKVSSHRWKEDWSESA